MEKISRREALEIMLFGAAAATAATGYGAFKGKQYLDDNARHNPPQLTEVTPQNATDILDRDKPVVFDFYANWCMPCKHYEPIFKGHSEKYHPSEVLFARCNYDMNPDLVSRFKVGPIPTLVFYQKGKEPQQLGYDFLPLSPEQQVDKIRQLVESAKEQKK